MNIEIPSILIPAHQSLPGLVGSGKIISADSLSAYSAAYDVLAEATELAHKLQRQAEALLADARNEAVLIASEAQKRGEEEAQRLLDEARKELHQEMDQALQQNLLQAMQWLVDVSHLEQAIVQRLEQRIREYIAPIFKAAINDQDQVALLVKRISTYLPELISRDSLNLQVHPEVHVQIQKQFVDEQRIQVINNAELASGQAILDNGLLQIKIDLAQHSQQLYRLLAGEISIADDANLLEKRASLPVQSVTTQISERCING